ncbi:MAG: hypothetical protein HY819_14705 [Acidobacteria bacterium]|nr:hypothetical protein [Acidobacteriota bacterium]
MKKLILVTDNQLVSYQNLKEVDYFTQIPLMAYLEGSFTFSEILDLLAFPLIYASAKSIFDFREIKNLFEKELPKNFALLVKRVGYANALELLLGSNEYRAEELCCLRLVNEIYTEETFQKQVERLSNLSLSAIELALDLTERMPHLANAQAEILERYVFALRFTHPDQKEGMQAFLEKRPPNFPNKLT